MRRLACGQHLGFGTIGNPLGTPIPHQLEPGTQCYAVVDVATTMAVVDAPLRDKTLGRMVWPVVQIGNGRKRKGKAVEIPVRQEATAPPVGSSGSSSWRSPAGRPTHLLADPRYPGCASRREQEVALGPEPGARHP